MIKLPKYSERIFNGIMLSEEINKLFSLFKMNNFEIRIAGGAVRDILMDIEPKDIDFATDATPDEMKKMFHENSIRLVNNNGESHGTITARINDKENFEITTLRYDKVTDGRRAEVVFTKDWKIDAERRDLTINSMFLDKDGFVYDYFAGIADIQSRTIRFVGDPEKRIQEDHLRILRYFRFYGRIADKPDKHLDETIKVIRENGSKLKYISGERIWSEMKKIISGNFAVEIIDKMSKCKILSYLGLPEDPSLIELEKHYEIMRKNNSNPSVFLSTLFENESELQTAWKRLKLSNNELICAHYIISQKGSLSQIIRSDCALNFFKDKFIMHTGEPPLDKLKMAYNEYMKYVDRIDLWKSFCEWQPPRFPINGNVLSKRWEVRGKKVGMALTFLKSKWKDSNYTATTEDLVDSETLRNEFMKSYLEN